MPPPTNQHQKLSLFHEIITTLLRNFYKSAKKHAVAQAHQITERASETLCRGKVHASELKASAAWTHKTP